MKIEVHPQTWPEYGSDFKSEQLYENISKQLHIFMCRRNSIVTIILQDIQQCLSARVRL